MAEMVLRGQPEREISVSHKNYGTVNKNSVNIATGKGFVALYFSYDTLIGVRDASEKVISENQWGQTTGKFLNELQPDKSRRVPHEAVLMKAQERLRQVLY
jgi:hypothetical protein